MWNGGNVFQEKVPGAIVIGNAFGKLAGSTQVQELGRYYVGSHVEARDATVVGHRGTAEALPIDSTLAILKRCGAVRP
jgi:hypothetical protein